jgi:hypothetical protein
MNHILDIKEQASELHQLFEIIRDGNCILLLGAGASVGAKKYLSRQVIEYYQDYLGKNLNEDDITRFVDILSADPSFRREHFDQEVEKMLRKLEVTGAHKTLAGIPWQEIITTNYDLLVEKAFDEVRESSEYDIIPIRSANKYNYRRANNEIKYVKLNGCISDKSQYPLVFSTDDFKKSNTFYKMALNDLKNVSPKISFVSIGYSYIDPLGKQLLDKFDSYNYRERRWMINVDPYPNEGALDYFTQKRVRIIKASFEEFFAEYNTWLEAQMQRTVSRKSQVFTTNLNSQIQIPSKLRLQLSGVIKQLNSSISERSISDKDYFNGEEPNFKVILNNIDVFRQGQFKSVSDQILKTLSESSSTFIPLFYLSGDFGIGKSTFTLRLIHELSKDKDLAMVAFEILDFTKLRKEYLTQLFAKSNAKNIILYCDEIEVDSTFKNLIDLRRELSIEQFNDFNVIFLAPVRENILLKHLKSRDVKESHQIKIEGKLTSPEINELVEKLKNAGLVDYRSANEKASFVSKILKDFKGDSFIALLEIVTSGKHINDLLSAYNQLSNEAQNAFVNTALVHQHKMWIPASWLKQVISLDWTDFTESVIKAEGKGILYQERKDHTGTEPDLFFRTKHPLIARKLIEKIVPSSDKQYKMYENIFNKVDFGRTNSRIVTDLLKILKNETSFSNSRIQVLYDKAHSKLGDDPYFLLNYAINLQGRKNEKDIQKAIDHLMYAESLLDSRNHRFIHRRAVLNFELAKIYLDKEKTTLNFTRIYLDEAKSLFVVKQLLDPFSEFSYYDYIKLLIWELANIQYEVENELYLRIQIQELFDLASRAVIEETSRLDKLRLKYSNEIKKTSDGTGYKEYLDELYSDGELRPFACILLYSYYDELSTEESELKCIELVDEMKTYLFNNEVVKFLFKYFGRLLHSTNDRIFFFELAKNHRFLEDEIPLRYHYYHFIAESYSRNFSYGFSHLDQIESRYHGLNPEFNIVWANDYGTEEVFDGIVVKGAGHNYKALKVPSLQKTFRLVKGNYEQFSVGARVNVKLHFYIYGLRAEIVEDQP